MLNFFCIFRIRFAPTSPKGTAFIFNHNSLKISPKGAHPYTLTRGSDAHTLHHLLWLQVCVSDSHPAGV